MNKLFGAVNNLFESDNDVILTERGHKYIKKLPDDEIEDKDYWRPKDYQDTRTGEKFSSDEIRSKTRYNAILDNIKHLAPTGCYFVIKKPNARWTNYLELYVVGKGEKKGEEEIRFLLCKIKLDIDENDEYRVEVTKDSSYYDKKPTDMFNREITLKDVAKDLAAEKGVTLNDEFMIDNGAEIKAKYQEIKSKNMGTQEELIDKIQKQIEKLPQSILGKTLRQMHESVKVKGKLLKEAWDESMPNWLKETAAHRNTWQGPTLNSNTKFKTLSRDELKNITKMAKKARDKGQILFIRLGNFVYWYNDRRWRSCTDWSNQRSEESMMDAIESQNQYNIVAGCITLNYKESKEDEEKLMQDRAEAIKGSIDRNLKARPGDTLNYYSRNLVYDKSGYLRDITKYTNMLRDIRQKRLASSDILEELEKKDFVNRFNELGKKAAEYIGQNINLAYKDADSYYGNHYTFDKSDINIIENVASRASEAIYELFQRINYIKKGEEENLRGDLPDANVDKWLQAQIDKVEESLKDFEDALKPASTEKKPKDKSKKESVKVNGKNILKEWSSSSILDAAFSAADYYGEEPEWEDIIDSIVDKLSKTSIKKIMKDQGYEDEDEFYESLYENDPDSVISYLEDYLSKKDKEDIISGFPQPEEDEEYDDMNESVKVNNIKTLKESKGIYKKALIQALDNGDLDKETFVQNYADYGEEYEGLTVNQILNKMSDKDAKQFMDDCGWSDLYESARQKSIKEAVKKGKRKYIRESFDFSHCSDEELVDEYVKADKDIDNLDNGDFNANLFNFVVSPTGGAAKVRAIQDEVERRGIDWDEFIDKFIAKSRGSLNESNYADQLWKMSTMLGKKRLIDAANKSNNAEEFKENMLSYGQAQIFSYMSLDDLDRLYNMAKEAAKNESVKINESNYADQLWQASTMMGGVGRKRLIDAAKKSNNAEEFKENMLAYGQAQIFSYMSIDDLENLYNKAKEAAKNESVKINEDENNTQPLDKAKYNNLMDDLDDLVNSINDENQMKDLLHDIVTTFKTMAEKQGIKLESESQKKLA